MPTFPPELGAVERELLALLGGRGKVARCSMASHQPTRETGGCLMFNKMGGKSWRFGHGSILEIICCNTFCCGDMSFHELSRLFFSFIVQESLIPNKSRCDFMEYQSQLNQLGQKSCIGCIGCIGSNFGPSKLRKFTMCHHGAISICPLLIFGPKTKVRSKSGMDRFQGG